MTFIPETPEEWAAFIKERTAQTRKAPTVKPVAGVDPTNPDNPFLTMSPPDEMPEEIVDGHNELGERVLDSDEKRRLGQLIDEYTVTDSELKLLQTALKGVREDIEELLGDSEFKDDENFVAKIAYSFPAPRKTLDKKALEEAHPELTTQYNFAAEGFMKEGKRSSRLTITPPKETA